MFESLSEKLDYAFKSLKGDTRLTELNIANSVKEIRRALVAADVNYKIAKEFTDKIKDKALGKENVLSAVNRVTLWSKLCWTKWSSSWVVRLPVSTSKAIRALS
jgi:signal recognition particle subunit SRP54